VLLVALGAVAGLAIGMAVADRAGGLNGLVRRVRRRKQRQIENEALAAGEASVLFREGPEGLAAYEDALYEGAQDELYDEEEHAEESDESSATIGRGPGPQVPTADELEMRILSLFRNDARLSARNIDIGADHHGRVELTGWVADAAEAEYARALVRSMPEVTDILDNLVVRRRAAG
jgi:hypothetical protein